MELTDKKDWDKYYSEKKKGCGKKIAFEDLFGRYLVKNGVKKTVIEIGCAGGEFLYHLASTYNYIPFGVDYSEAISKTAELFRNNNAPIPTLYKEDLFTWISPQKYDLVCSFGFIEHFSDEQFKEAIQHHAALVAPHGLLIMTMPHFAHLQYPLHFLLDKENLKLHNTRIMNLSSLKNALVDLPFEILELRYYGTFEFWVENRQLNLIQKLLYRIIQRVALTTRSLLGNDKPNPFVSPHIVCVARKKAP